jgi:hypothetical protein
MTFSKSHHAVIIGCGGVGSHLAILLARQKAYANYTLVDGDQVEAKNLERQHYFTPDVGKPKVEALRDHLLAIDAGLTINTYPAFLRTEADYNTFKTLLNSTRGVESFGDLYIATDSNQSKIDIWKKLNPICVNKILVNCERDFYEVKCELDDEERATWQLGTGYNTEQTWASNLTAAGHIVRHVLNDGARYGTHKLPR